MVAADRSAALAAEGLFVPIRTRAVAASCRLMIDSLDLETLMKLVP
jgi:hypothetical protein